MKITEPQANALRYLADVGETTATAVAAALWPDSPGWGRRSHRHATPASGAMAVGLKMNAGRLLGRLRSMGLVSSRTPMSATLWSITPSGFRALAEYVTP